MTYFWMRVKKLYLGLTCVVYSAVSEADVKLAIVKFNAILTCYFVYFKVSIIITHTVYSVHMSLLLIGCEENFLYCQFKRKIYR